ncbi:class I SAM-dependent methyltransferase [Mycolicibacterium aichiense]|uniref:class I SAM-dependent methyltransferase n=1 Tax=Mycolicibacterium aichiense TaxID=1799 RepID=UPI003D676ACE
MTYRLPRFWAREVMDRETRQFVEAMSPGTLEALEISGEEWRHRVAFKSYKSVSYPEFDICSEALDEQFDVIVAEQVFEHLLQPQDAAENVYAMLRPGGYFVITTPFLIKVHPAPHDCSRWTETGLWNLLMRSGFDSVETASWGNRACVKANFSRWVRYRPWHSLRNDPEFPAVVWAFARKAPIAS